MGNDIFGLVANLLKDPNLTDSLNNLVKNNPNLDLEKNTSGSDSANIILQRIEELEQQLTEKETLREEQLKVLIQEIQETKELILDASKQKSWFSKLFKR